MSRLLRNTGFGLVVLGLVLVVIWAVEPLRALWPWIRGLPLVVRVGVGVAAIGLAVLLGSLIAERLGEREADKALLDEL